jgi:hypothetical protein
MPFPLAPLIPIAIRLGVLTLVGYTAKRLVGARTYPGRTDQRAEDALDDLGDGLALHRPTDLANQRQANTTARLQRTIRFQGKVYDLDAGLIARFRIRKHDI